MTLPNGHNSLQLGRFSLVWRPRACAAGLGLLILLLLLALLLLGTGKMSLPAPEILAGLTGTGDDPVAARILQRVRLPRVLTAIGVGAALGMSGAVFQSLSRNALGSPDVIGFTTGAATGAIAQITLGSLDPFHTGLAAVGSGLLTATAVLLLARRGGSGAEAGYRLILVGIGMGAVLTGANTLLLVKGELDRVMSAQIWLAGSLSARNWDHVTATLIGLCLFAPLVLLLSRRLNLLEMGDDMARQLGVSAGQSRAVLVLAAVGLCSIGTAATGPIAFIALAAPQIARRLTRAPQVPVITGAITGSVLLLGADLLSQAAPFDLTLPIGLTTGFLGGAYLLFIMASKKQADGL